MKKDSILFNPFDPEFHADPYPVFARLRKQDPVHKSLLNTWIITRYADAEAILKDKRFQVDNLPERIQGKNRYIHDGNLNEISDRTHEMILFLDPPDHARLRKPMNQMFSEANVENMRFEIQLIVDNLLAKVEKTGNMDIVSDLASPLSALTISKILGLPSEDHKKLAEWSSETSFILGQSMPLNRYQKINQIFMEKRAYFAEKIRQFKDNPTSGLISYLVNEQDIEQRLTDNEILSIGIMLNIAAQETTRNLIGNGVLALLRHPESLEHLRQNPHQISNAVEEFLRYDSPLQVVARRASEDIEIAGKVFSSGDTVIIYIGSANRDPAQFTNPDQLDFNRQNRHIAFGGGIHYCLGAFLAKIEAQIAINTLLQRLSNISIDTDHLDWYESVALRGLKALPIKFSSTSKEK